MSTDNQATKVARYLAYNTGSRRAGKRSWCVIEEDGTEDGRLVCSDLTESDASRIVRLLNADEETVSKVET